MHYAEWRNCFNLKSLFFWAPTDKRKRLIFQKQFRLQKKVLLLVNWEWEWAVHRLQMHLESIFTAVQICSLKGWSHKEILEVVTVWDIYTGNIRWSAASVNLVNTCHKYLLRANMHHTRFWSRWVNHCHQCWDCF